MHADTPRLPSHVTSRVVYLITPITVCVGKRQGRSPVSPPIRYVIGTWSVPHLHRIHEFDSVHGLDDSHGRVVLTARALYRCWLSCKNAFPSPDLKKEWANDVWNEACAKEAYPDLFRQDEEAGPVFLIHVAQIYPDFQFVYSSLGFLNDIKVEIKHAVESLYGFDTSRAPDIISRNASRAQALLSNMTFIYQVRLILSPYVAN
jgi:hypothetical protein